MTASPPHTPRQNVRWPGEYIVGRKKESHQPRGKNGNHNGYPPRGYYELWEYIHIVKRASKHTMVVVSREGRCLFLQKDKASLFCCVSLSNNPCMCLTWKSLSQNFVSLPQRPNVHFSMSLPRLTTISSYCVLQEFHAADIVCRQAASRQRSRAIDTCEVHFFSAFDTHTHIPD